MTSSVVETNCSCATLAAILFDCLALPGRTASGSRRRVLAASTRKPPLHYGLARRSSGRVCPLACGSVRTRRPAHAHTLPGLFWRLRHESITPVSQVVGPQTGPVFRWRCPGPTLMLHGIVILCDTIRFVPLQLLATVPFQVAFVDHCIYCTFSGSLRLLATHCVSCKRAFLRRWSWVRAPARSPLLAPLYSSKNLETAGARQLTWTTGRRSTSGTARRKISWVNGASSPSPRKRNRSTFARGFPSFHLKYTWGTRPVRSRSAKRSAAIELGTAELSPQSRSVSTDSFSLDREVLIELRRVRLFHLKKVDLLIGT